MMAVLAVLILTASSCVNKKNCEKKYGDWIAKLEKDTIFFTDTVYIPPIVILDTINITELMQDTALIYQPVITEDPKHKATLAYWKDAYGRLIIRCQTKPDTIRAQGERIVIKVKDDPPDKGIGTFWEIVLVISLLIALGLVVKGIISKFT